MLVDYARLRVFVFGTQPAMRYLLILLVFSPALLAQTVYKSVEEGVTSFSDTPPETGDAEVLQIDVQEPAKDGLLESRLAEMRETTDRMAADRREREATRRAALASRAADESRPQTSADSDLTPQNWGISQWSSFAPGFRPRPYPHLRPHPYPIAPWRPGHPGLRPTPRPLPGIATPTPPPGWSVIQPGNSQLMRPIVSSRK
ncbi:MAG: hypothetical protein Cons2KO_14870 [Congregibacter sp.]